MKKITLLLCSFLLISVTAFSNNDTFFFENDVFTVTKAAINKTKNDAFSINREESMSLVSSGKLIVNNSLDTTPPVLESNTPSSSSITETGFSLLVDIDEAGTIYYVVLADGAGAPTAAEVKAGTGSGGSGEITSGYAQVTSGDFDNVFSVTGLTAVTDYDVYVVAEDGEVTPNLQASPTGLDLSTVDLTAPLGYGVGQITSPVSASNDDAVSISITGLQQGDTYNWSITDGATTPVSGSGTATATGTTTVSPIDVSGLNDGTLTVSVTSTDPSNNEGQPITATTEKDTVAPTNYGVNQITSPVNAGNDDSVSINITGLQQGDTYNWSISDAGNVNTVSGSGTAAATGTTTVGSINVSSLNDGTLTVSVTSTDPSNNTGNAETGTTTKDTVAPTGYAIANATDPINSTNQTSISFDITGLETDGDYAWSITDGNTTLNGSGSAGGNTSVTISSLDVSSLNDGTLTITVISTDASGNEGQPITGTTEKDAVAPAISGLLMSSNNSNTTLAKEGDVITLVFTSSETINTPTVTLATQNAVVTNNGNAWSASITVIGNSLEGLTGFSISNISDTAGNTLGNIMGTIASSVTIDVTAPTLSNIVMSSNNNNNALAKEGDVITLTFTSDEVINTPTVTIAGRAATVSNNGNAWSAQITVLENDTQDAAAFVISTISDIVGNTASDIITLSSGVPVDIDTIKPEITLVGDNPQIIDINTPYVELGATALDSHDGVITPIVINSSAVILATVGCYPVTYTVTDASGNTRVVTRIVFVLEPGKPWAKDNSFTVNQDSSNNIFNVIANDSYGTDGANGTHPISLSGTYTDNGGKLDLVGTNVQYTPRAGFSGVDNFSYTITDENGDGSGDASKANVTITVSLNAKPTAVDDAVIVAKNSGATPINVIVNDSFGADGSHPTEALTVSGASIGASTEGGTTAVNSNTNEIAYTPALNFTGADSFTYTIKDTGGDTSTATVLVTVTIVDIVTPTLRPTALPDAITVNQNSSNNVINVLADNGAGADSFGSKGAIADGLTMPDGTYSGASDRGGVISVNKNNIATTLDDEILYTPKAGFIGEDGFKYMITDTTGDTSITTVVVTVTQIATPTAVADAVSVLEGSNLISIDVLANDSFGLDGAAVAPSITLTSVSSAGSTIVVNSEKVDYTPLGAFSGIDTFSYTITDGTGDISSTTTVTVTVSAAGTSNVPLAQDDSVTVTQNSVENLINVLDDNGSGADSYGSDGANASHPISLSGFYTDNGGELELNGNVVKYTPRTGFVGTDSFNYTLTDLNGDAAAATVTITVGALPVVLTAVDDAVTVGQDSGATNILVLGNDVLVAGTSITVFDTTTINGGGISLDDNGTPTNATDDFLIYTPDSGYTGVDTFTYTISDGVASSTATVTVTVDSAAVIPGVLAAKADAFTVAQYSTNIELNVFADNGSGADNYGTAGPKDGGLTLINGTLTGATEQGSVTIIGNQITSSPLDDRIVYTPNANYSGVDHFYYMITAVDGNTAIAQVTITVTPTALTTITAVDDALTVDFNSTNTSIDIFANDLGVRNLDNSANINVDAIAFNTFSNGGSISQVDGGTVGFNDDHFLYTPVNGFSGTETVTYIITFNSTATTTASITFTVNPTTTVNGVPTAKNDAVSVIRNSVNHVINILNDNGSGADDFGTDGQSATHPISLSGTFTDIGSKIELDGNTVKYTPKTNFTGTDTFGYTITDANGDASSAIVTVNITVSKSSSETASTIEEVLQVYPNPSKGDLNVSVFSKNGDQISILLFDVTGKVVYKDQRELSIGKNIIDLNLRLKAGIMFLKVYSENNNYGTKKIVFK